MDKRMLGKTGYMISPVVFGGIINTNETQEDANRYVAYAVDRGVNFFDVAPAYGDAEERLGVALKPYRKDVYLACKSSQRGAKGAKDDLFESMRRLKTDYFDLYQLHCIKTPEDVDGSFALNGAMETVEWAIKEGIVRKAGITAHIEEQALRCLDLYDFESVLYTFNWAHGVLSGVGDKLSEAVTARNIGLLCMKVFTHRMWREDETRPAQKKWYKYIDFDSPLALAAMKYPLAKGGTALVPPGDFEVFRFMLDHVEEAIANPLTQSDIELLKDEAAKIKGYEFDLNS